MIATGFYYDYGHDIEQALNAIRALIKQECHGIRRFGACTLDLCYVAAGRFDAYFELRLNAWDFAAGYLIVKEAGGLVLNLDGNDLSLKDTQLIATNGHLVEKLRKIILESA